MTEREGSSKTKNHKSYKSHKIIMNKNYIKRFQELPEFVQDAFGGDDYLVNIKIMDDYKLTEEMTQSLMAIKFQILLKDIKLEEISGKIQKDLKVDKKIADEITLILLRETYYPVKDFFPGIEDEILKMGGKIPKEKPKMANISFLKREDEMDEMREEEEKMERERTADTIIYDSIENLMKNYSQAGEYIIGNQKAIEVKNMPVPMKPMVKYWIEDYRNKMGYAYHSNIDRMQYVYHDKNTKAMNEEERRQLNLILKSLDERTKLPYSIKRKKIDFSVVKEE